MSAKDDGGPAYPVREADRFNPDNNETHTIEQFWGISIRDWFAGMAMNGILSNIDDQTLDKSDPYTAAEVSYVVADAMLAERAKP